MTDTEPPNAGPSDAGPAGPTMSLAELRAATQARLASAGLDNARVEAVWLLEEATGLDPAEQALEAVRPVTVGQVGRLDAMVARRVGGEPLQYVLGRWAFRKLDLATDARALIPRPETEAVVEVALGELDRAIDAGRRTPLAVDLGTGTGAIALSLVAERSRVQVIATERSSDAMALARANLAGLGAGAERVRLAEGSWWEALDPTLEGSVDLVVSNPPYVPDDAPLPPTVADWEPTAALRAGTDGLDDLRLIIAGAARWLRPGGALVVEIGDDQGVAAAALAQEVGLGDVAVHPDLAGRDRTLAARRAMSTT